MSPPTGGAGSGWPPVGGHAALAEEMHNIHTEIEAGTINDDHPERIRYCAKWAEYLQDKSGDTSAGDS